MQELARAKINLSLRVPGRRADGYHEVESLVTFADVGDVLFASPEDELSLSVTGPFAAQLAGEPENLVLRAAMALRSFTGLPRGARLILEKNLPVASGIGGGSADAAAALRALIRLGDIEIDEANLLHMAIELGADVPVCLQSRTAMMRGIGERITPVEKLPAFWMVLANPSITISTTEIFQKLNAPSLNAHTHNDVVPDFKNFESLLDWLKRNPNDLQASAISIAPVIADVLWVLDETTNCRLARMSGSGATCFALFAREEEARSAALKLRSAEPNWWIAVSGCG